jgi:hypothetical protein
MTNNDRRVIRFDGADEKRDTFGLIDSLSDPAAIGAAALVGREVVKQTGETIREKIRQGSKDQAPKSKNKK